jgi:predicted transglutaminase-like cysteine proteinase
MRFLGYARALRAAILACGLGMSSLGLIGSAGGAAAASLQIAGALRHATESAEPFGLAATRIYFGGMLAKWLGVIQRLDDERVQLALCEGDREHCASAAALQFLAIVDVARQRDGRARLGEINRAINLAIHPVGDLAQFGEIDVWSSPLVTFYRGAGDCEDYAIAKYEALRVAGIPAEDLRIVVLSDVLRGEGHAVAAVRLDGHWLILDNRRMAMIEDVAVRNYRALFVIDQFGVMKYFDTPLLASLPDRDADPAALPNATGMPDATAASPLQEADGLRRR